jgi:hypothetical protein
MGETYVRVKGTWKYLYRAVDKAGARVDFLLTAKRDRKAALRFLRKAIKWNGTPEKITIDKSGANTAAIQSQNVEHGAGIEIRQIKYLNNIVEAISPSVWKCTDAVCRCTFMSSAACWPHARNRAPGPMGPPDRRISVGIPHPRRTAPQRYINPIRVALARRRRDSTGAWRRRGPGLCRTATRRH